MKFSVITCTWNSERYLEQCLVSIAQQRDIELEHIIVDGGSEDKTLDIARSILPETKILTGITGGISKAMNVGARVATGEVIAHLHSDDFYLHPQVLSTVAKAGIGPNNWGFGRIAYLRDGEVIQESFKEPVYSRNQLLKGNFIPHPATFVGCHLFTQCKGFSETLRYAMDYDLWLRMSLLSQPVQLGEPLAMFRIHEGSLSSKHKAPASAEDQRVRRLYLGNNPLLWLESEARFFKRLAMTRWKNRHAG
jgi:glycosyltransferase involved in cell wall biosynthesis